MTVVIDTVDVAELLVSKAEKNNSEKELDNLIINNFENPEIAIFDRHIGPTLLSNSPNNIKVKGDDENETLKNKLITSFVDAFSDNAIGLMMRRINDDTYFGVNFTVHNDYARGKEDLYLLFTRCNDNVINSKQLEKELNDIAEAYAQLITDGLLMVEQYS
ncbi:hypothetical protein GF352_01165 [archaeon]|nr:hypothetical protein [archaeon]